MFTTIHNKKMRSLIVLGMIVLVLLGLVLYIAVQRTLAIANAAGTCLPDVADGNTSTITCTGPTAQAHADSFGVAGKFCTVLIHMTGPDWGEILFMTPEGFVAVSGPDGFAPPYTYIPCSSGETPPPPGIWMSDVCEPFDGFSGDGWTTVSSDADSLPWGTVLYVAASEDGPWHETGFAQPPYIISESQMDALAALVGAPTRAGVWMKASPVGTPANYGSMVQDREWHMDDLCGN